jgi:two-component system cell cycle sensor histidine kinase/response regulator CckA
MPLVEPVVLLVDDEPAVLALLTSGLAHAGFRVVTARTGADAFQRASKLGRIDVLATDVVLPDRLRLAKDHLQQPVMHGIALMRRLIALQPSLKVILFSGQPTELINNLGGIPQGTTFLRKPFSIETLVRSVRQALERPPATGR